MDLLKKQFSVKKCLLIILLQKNKQMHKWLQSQNFHNTHTPYTSM